MGERVCDPVSQNDGHPDLHFENGGSDGPDARLIAAAPDLLEACQLVLTEFSEFAALWKIDTESDGVSACRAAVAKATGATS